MLSGPNEQGSLDDRVLRSLTMTINSIRYSSTKKFSALKKISGGERKNVYLMRTNKLLSHDDHRVWRGDSASETRSRAESLMLRDMVNEEGDTDLNERERFISPMIFIIIENDVTMRCLFVEKSFMTLGETCRK